MWRKKNLRVGAAVGPGHVVDSIALAEHFGCNTDCNIANCITYVNSITFLNCNHSCLHHLVLPSQRQSSSMGTDAHCQLSISEHYKYDHDHAKLMHPTQAYANQSQDAQQRLLAPCKLSWLAAHACATGRDRSAQTQLAKGCVGCRSEHAMYTGSQ